MLWRRCHAEAEAAGETEEGEGIKLTDFLREHPEWFELGHETEFERYKRFIAAGSLIAANVQLLCARHNLQKSAHIQ